MAGDASDRIDAYIGGLPDAQRDVVAHLRALVHEADPGITEEWKWSTPVFAHDGMVCAIGAFKDHLKINFFKGASLPDPRGVFNAGLDAKAMRSVDIHPGDPIDEAGLRDLVSAAVELNQKGG
jgi:hypothetical protein